MAELGMMEELRDILMDLEAMNALLEVIGASGYYDSTEDVKIYRALQNGTEYIIGKMKVILK